MYLLRNYSKIRLNWSKDRWKNHIRYSVDLKSFGLISDDDLNIQTESQAFKEMYNKISEFSDKLDPVPDRFADKAKYIAAVNANETKVNRYMKAEATKALNIEQSQVDYLCNPANFGISISDADAYIRWRQESADMWAAFSPLWNKVVSAKTQVAITKRDQYAGLDLTEKDIESINKDVRKVSYLTAQFSLMTGKRSYIEGTPKSQKLLDLEKFKAEIAKADVLARIVNITGEQVPPKEIFAELAAFKRDPSNKTSRDALAAAINKFKNTLIKDAKAAKAAGTVFDLNSKLK